MKKERNLFRVLRKDRASVPSELNREFSEDYCSFLGEICKFEKILMYNGVVKDREYSDVKNVFVENFKNLKSYFGKGCSDLGGNIDYSLPVESGCISNVFDARIQLRRDSSRLLNDIKDFDYVAGHIGIDIDCKEYVLRKRAFEDSFEKYFSVLDSRLRSIEML
jgi:hypothetical protein